MSTQRRTPRLIALLLLMSLIVSFTTPAQAAEPGAELLNTTGTLNPDIPTRTVPLAESGAANIRLAVSGGAATDTLTLNLLNSSGSSIASWVGHSGETIWGFAELPSGAKLRLSTSGAALNFDLRAYARGTVLAPTEGSASWSGTALGAAAGSTRSTVKLNVATAGLYRFTLGASSGSYQLVVDDTLIRKTVVSGSTPAASDTVYYLEMGVHTFRVVQDATAGVSSAWSVQLAAAGALDNLPYAENSAVLGGGTGGGAFTEEWLPIQLATAQAVNIQITATGTASDSLQIELYSAGKRVFGSAAVAGGEKLWGSAQLGAGANALRVVSAAGNSAPLAYSISVSALPGPNQTWTGVSYGKSAGTTQLRFTVARAGLYRLTLGASTGRYQLRLNNTALQKIVTAAGADFSAFLPTGTHTLDIMQDGSATTTWSVKVAASNATVDTLPFSRAGTTLGGADREFGEEWLPLRLTAEMPVNLRLIAKGESSGDALQVQIYKDGSATPTYSAAKVYAGETFWATTKLGAGTSRLRISAAAGNIKPMEYTIQITPVGSIPTSWSGVTLGGGLNSTLTLNAPNAGVYTLVMTLTAGSALVAIDPQNSAPAALLSVPAPDSTNVTLRVPLSAGPHIFQVQQDAAEARTEWQVAISPLRDAIPLSISQIAPGLLAKGSGGDIQVSGTGFESGTTAALIDAKGGSTPMEAVVVSGTALLLSVPATTPMGIYSLRLRNPDGSTITRAGAVSVGQIQVFLPLVRR